MIIRQPPPQKNAYHIGVSPVLRPAERGCLLGRVCLAVVPFGRFSRLERGQAGDARSLEVLVLEELALLHRVQLVEVVLRHLLDFLLATLRRFLLLPGLRPEVLDLAPDRLVLTVDALLFELGVDDALLHFVVPCEGLLPALLVQLVVDLHLRVLLAYQLKHALSRALLPVLLVVTIDELIHLRFIINEGARPVRIWQIADVLDLALHLPLFFGRLRQLVKDLLTLGLMVPHPLLVLLCLLMSGLNLPLEVGCKLRGGDFWGLSGRSNGLCALAAAVAADHL